MNITSLIISCVGLSISVIGFVFTVIIWMSTDKAYRRIRKIIKRELLNNSKFFIYYLVDEKDPRHCLLLECFMNKSIEKLYKGLPPSSWNNVTIETRFQFADGTETTIENKDKLLNYPVDAIYVNTFLSKRQIRKFKKQKLSDNDIKQITNTIAKLETRLLNKH